MEPSPCTRTGPTGPDKVSNLAPRGIDSHAKADCLAAAVGDTPIRLMGSQRVAVIGPTVHDAFDEWFIAQLRSI